MSDIAGAKHYMAQMLRRIGGSIVLLYALLAPLPAAADTCYALYGGPNTCAYYSFYFGDWILMSVYPFGYTTDPYATVSVTPFEGGDQRDCFTYVSQFIRLGATTAVTAK